MTDSSIPLGSSGDLVVITKKLASDAVSAADAAPTFAIYGDIGSAAILSSLASTALETGVYYKHQILTAASGFAAGKEYTVLASYDTAGNARRQHYKLRVT